MPHLTGLIIILAVLAAIFSIAGKAFSKDIPNPKISPPCRKKQSIMTDAERVLFYTLLRAVPEGHFVFANMRLIDLLDFEGKGQSVQTWRNKTKQKHVDFVICDPNKLSPLMVIELDGKTHAARQQAQRDADKDACLQAAEIPLVRLPANPRGYTVEDLRRHIEDNLMSLSK